MLINFLEKIKEEENRIKKSADLFISAQKVSDNIIYNTSLFSGSFLISLFIISNILNTPFQDFGFTIFTLVFSLMLTFFLFPFSLLIRNLGLLRTNKKEIKKLKELGFHHQFDELDNYSKESLNNFIEEVSKIDSEIIEYISKNSSILSSNKNYQFKLIESYLSEKKIKNIEELNMALDIIENEEEKNYLIKKFLMDFDFQENMLSSANTFVALKSTKMNPQNHGKLDKKIEKLFYNHLRIKDLKTLKDIVKLIPYLRKSEKTISYYTLLAINEYLRDLNKEEFFENKNEIVLIVKDYVTELSDKEKFADQMEKTIEKHRKEEQIENRLNELLIEPIKEKNLIIKNI